MQTRLRGFILGEKDLDNFLISCEKHILNFLNYRRLCPWLNIVSFADYISTDPRFAVHSQKSVGHLLLDNYHAETFMLL